MHELSLVQELIKILDRNVLEHQFKKVGQIVLRVGVLSNVVPDALRFAFRALTEGTIYEKAELVLEEVPVRLLCENCEEEVISSEILFTCPHCQSQRAVFLEGAELVLASLTGEGEEDAED